MNAQNFEKNMVWKSTYVNTTEFTTLNSDKEIKVLGNITGEAFGKLLNVKYNLEINQLWEIQRFKIDLQSDASFSIELHKNKDNQWVDEKGTKQTQFDGCSDIDISLTPFTNTLPINRLNLKVGEAKEISVIYIDLPTNQCKPSRQRYTNLGNGMYKYESLQSGFTSNLEVDKDGLVLNYPGIWHRVLPDDEISSRQKEAFSLALISKNSSPDLDNVEKIYDWLIGSWKVEAIDYLENKEILKTEGEWLFTKILEGRAIQDVWIAPKRSLRASNSSKKGNRYGTTIRYYDASIKKWQIKWINPVSGAFAQLTAWKENRKIIQEGLDEEGNLMRWSFEDITANSFHWKGERSNDKGKTFVLEAEFFGKR